MVQCKMGIFETEENIDQNSMIPMNSRCCVEILIKCVH